MLPSTEDKDHLYCLYVQVEGLHGERELQLRYGSQLPVCAETLQQ